ncbi:MAG: glycoside hydrolase family 57 protein [Nanoarchaeota archaeon]
MVSVCFYFQVHQPMRLAHYTVFDIGHHSTYFNEEKNKQIMEKVARKCYLPTNKLMLQLINESDGRFKIAYSLTGVFLEQAEAYCPEIIDSFKELAATGKVEFLSETYYHTLAYLYSKKEFDEQVELHAKRMRQLFGQRPQVFRNTELIYNNELAHHIEGLGYKGVIAEGADHILGWRSPNFVYTPKTAPKLKLLLKNFRLSDDIAFRFSNSQWAEYPLTADKFSDWVSKVNGNGNCVNLFMDYETFGEHQWKETGIFEFLKALPAEVLKHQHLEFKTPDQVIAENPPVGEINVPYSLSWADIERDASAWLGNAMQRECFKLLESLEPKVRETRDDEMLHIWRLLQNSDHLYYLCTKSWADGDVHKYFSPFASPYDGFINYMNVLQDFKKELEKI